MIVIIVCVRGSWWTKEFHLLIYSTDVCQLPLFLQSTEMQRINLVLALPPYSPLQHINSWPAGQTKNIELGTHSFWSMRAGAGLLIVVIPDASLNLKTKGKSNMDQPPLSLFLSYFLSVDVGQP